jgi:hypothetical protein
MGRSREGRAKLAAEKAYHAVILSPFAVILSAAKNLALPLRVNYAKDLALSIFKARRDSSSPLLLRMTALSSFSASSKAPSFRPTTDSVAHFCNLVMAPNL